MIENKNTSGYQKSDAFSNREQEKNFEYQYQENQNDERMQDIYVLNLTPIRLGVILGVIAFAIILMFSIGFQTGLKKSAKSKTTDNAVQDKDILFRENSQAANMMPSAVKEGKTSNTIIDMASLGETKPSRAPEINMKITGGSDIPQSLAKDFDDIDKMIENKKQDISITSSDDIQMSSVPGENKQQNQTYKAAEVTKKAPAPVVKKENTAVKTPVEKESDVVYFIQVAVVANKEAAESDKDFLKKRFPRAFVKEDLAKDGSKIYKVKIGRYENKDDIEKALSDLKNIAARYEGSYIYKDKK